MEQFFYYDIFATKGLEYLIIIAFLLLLIPFSYFLNKKVKIKQVLRALSTNILKIPQGLFYSKNHLWLFMERSGEAKLGLDDLLLHITGEVQIDNIKNIGETITKGELLAKINKNDKILDIFSPISGKILNTNSIIDENKDWIFKIKPSNWIEETKTYYFATEATIWSHNELDRFKNFIINSNSSEVILQDGGELCDNTLSELPNEVWKDFQKEFMNI